MAFRTRREFLEHSMLAAAAAVAARPGASAFAADENQPATDSPNEKLGVAVVGCGGRGGDHLKDFAKRKGTEVLYVVDVDENIANARAKAVGEMQGRAPKIISDMREAFDDKSLDI